MERDNFAVSIIMPVYNSEKYLRSCVDSILSQEFDSFELLLIDDGSNDGSPAICDMYAIQDPRVHVFHKENGGICEARNYGMQRAQGEYIAFSDHDDNVLPGFLSENYRVAKENHADIVKFGRRGLLIKDDKQLSSDVRQFDDETLNHEQILKRFLQMRISGAMNCVWDGLFRRRFLEEGKIQFDTRYKKGGEDIDFCSRCFITATTAVMRSAIYYEHYIRIGISTSTVDDPEKLLKFKLLGDNLQSCTKLAGLDLSLQIGKYVVCICKEEVYTSIKYLLSIGEKYQSIRDLLNEIYDKRMIRSVSLSELKIASPKWAIFSWLFSNKLFFMDILVVRINMIKKKAEGTE